MWSRRPRAALVVVAVALASGCGSDATAENDYVGEVQRAQTAFVSRFDQTLGHLTATSTLAQDRATLGEFASITGRFGTSLARIQPPAGVRAQHRALVAAIARFRQQFERGRSRLQGGSAADRAAVRTQLSSSVDGTQAQVSKAIAAINAGLRN